nr:hypothetical protein [Tanacetum cinerariifolium]
MIEFSQMDSGLAVPVFSQGDDPIAYLNKAMAFLTTVTSSREGLLNAIISKVKDTWRGNALSLSNQGTAWFKKKAMLAEAQESGQILDKVQLAFPADPGILDCQAAQTTIPNDVPF